MLVVSPDTAVISPLFSRREGAGEQYAPLAVPSSSRHTRGMPERSKAEVAAFVRQRMKTLRITEHRLRVAANVDPKTLRGLLTGERWPQEETRLKVETILGWRAGSIQDLRDGGDAIAVDVDEDLSPLEHATDDELLGELRRRLASVGGGGFPDDAQDFRRPSGWRLPFDEPGVFGDQDSDERDESFGR